MRIVELIIDEKDDQSGIDAISVVMSPAIEENFIHLISMHTFKTRILRHLMPPFSLPLFI